MCNYERQIVKQNIIFLLCIFFFSCFEVLGASRFVTYKTSKLDLKSKNINSADSIMRCAISKAKEHESRIADFSAELYVKGHTEVLKSNFLYRFAPKIIPVDRRNKHTVFELTSELAYTSPNHFSHNLKAINGNVSLSSEVQTEVLKFLHINIYGETAYKDEVILPLSQKALKLYKFSLYSTDSNRGYKIYKIRFEPRYGWSTKLVCGYLYIVDGIWTVDRFDINGVLDFAEFNMQMSFKHVLNQFFLPNKVDIALRYKVLKNVVQSNYTVGYKYNDVQLAKLNQRKTRSYDLSQYYALENDSIPIIKDSIYWNSKRVVPLTGTEKMLYQHSIINREKERSSKHNRFDTLQSFKVTKQLTNSMNFSYKDMRMKYSGLLNPFKLGYSKSGGITYKQDLRLNKDLSNDRYIQFHPSIGFVFKRKEIFFKFGGQWVYAPKRMGGLSLWVGNANQGYSSELTNRVNDLLQDSTFNFDSLDVKYYKDYYVDIRNTFEVFNGLKLGVGLSYHFRKPVDKLTWVDIGSDIKDLVNSTYGDFTPILNVTYTPGQYYRMNGYRKEYVRSRYPTLTLEYAHGIPGILGSRGSYARIEAEIDQSVELDNLSRFSYRLGGGHFMNQRSTYFADFTFFARRNFPESWRGGMGGVFQLLDRNWYNAAPTYAQAHFMYESPFLLLRLMKRSVISRYVFSERLYMSQLYMPVLPSYTEIGYGVGNHIFNIGFFAGFEGSKYTELGVKFVFELFQ